MDAFTLSAEFYPLLFAVGLLAGFVDSIAGGGGLITIPALLSAGMPPQLALGTNKLQATFGTASATWHFGRAGLIDFRAAAPGVAFTLIGSVTGSLLVSTLPPGVLQQAIPWLLITISVYFIFQPEVADVARAPRLNAHAFHLMFGLALGFYDGFFGPGTGTFWAMAYVAVLGLNLLGATAQTKLMNFTSNAGSLAVFWIGGYCHLPAGICMGIGQLLGAQLGSKLAIRRGARFVRPIFIAMTLAITVRLLWQNFREA